MLYCSNESERVHLVHHSCDNLTEELSRLISENYCPNCRLDTNFVINFYENTSTTKKEEIMGLLNGKEFEKTVPIHSANFSVDPPIITEKSPDNKSADSFVSPKCKQKSPLQSIKLVEITSNLPKSLEKTPPKSTNKKSLSPSTASPKNTQKEVEVLHSKECPDVASPKTPEKSEILSISTKTSSPTQKSEVKSPLSSLNDSENDLSSATGYS